MSLLPARPRTISAVLAVVTFLSFAFSRLADAVSTVSLGDGPAVVLLGVLAAVVATGVSLVARGHDVRTVGVIALGPPIGLFAYLVVAVAVYGPSTDSPTWLLWLAFTAACLALGALAGVVGAFVRRSGVT